MGLLKKPVSIGRYSVRFYKYLLSYILLLTILLVTVGSVVYSNFITMLKKDVEASNVGALTQVKDTMDMRIREMERIAVQIASNPKLTYYSLTTYNAYIANEAVNELKTYKNTNAFVYDIALYYRSPDVNKIMYTTRGTSDVDTFFNIEYQYEEWGKENFFNTMEYIRTPTIRPVEFVRLNGVNCDSIATYIYPLPINSGKPYGVILFLIEGNVLRNMVRNILKDYSGYIYILDSKNQPVICLSSEKTKYDAEDFFKMLNVSTISDSISSCTIKNQKFSVVKITSDLNGWSYIIAMPTVQFMDKVYSTTRIFNYTVFAVLVLGVIISFIFATGNYKPLKKLAYTLDEQSSMQLLTQYNDEIDFISQTINQVTTENKGLMYDLRSKASIVKDKVIFDVLNGRLDILDDLKDISNICDVKLNGPYFVVMFFLIDDYDYFIRENNESMQDLLKFSIINVIEELSLDIGIGYGVDMIDCRGIFLLLNFEFDDNYKQKLAQLAIKTKDFFKVNFYFTLTVGIGNTYSDIAMVNESFQQSKRAAFYRLVKGKDQVIFYQDIDTEFAQNDRNLLLYSLENEEQLVMSIKQGISQDIERTVSYIIEDIKKRDISPELINCLCFNMLNVIIKVSDDMGISLDYLFDKEIEGLLKQKFETIEELKGKFVDICKRISEYIIREKESKNFLLRDMLITFVKNNFQNSNISLDVIASEFSLSPAYITRFFKDQTGYPLMRYVDILRMEKAKDLLRSTRLTLKEIAEKVGYTDVNNFSRRFKKREGVTPTQYRNISKLNAFGNEDNKNRTIDPEIKNQKVKIN